MIYRYSKLSFLCQVIEGEGHSRVSHINLIDLAGSERSSVSNTSGERLKVNHTHMSHPLTSCSFLRREQVSTSLYIHSVKLYHFLPNVQPGRGRKYTYLTVIPPLLGMIVIIIN